MKARRVGICGAFVIFVILTAWIISQWRETRSREHELPDGSMVVFRGVTYGKIRRFPPGTFWRWIAAHVLPAKYALRFPAYVYDDTNSGPAMVVWIEHFKRAPTGSYRYGGFPTYGDPPDWQGLFDDSGTDFDKSADLSTSTGRGFLQGFVFHALPGASRDLHFRFVCADSMKRWQGSAVFTFPNPAFSQREQNQVACPLSVEQDKLRLVLTGFHSEPPRRESYPNWMRLSFDLFEDGQPANDWELHSLAVLDQNGGVYHPNQASWRHWENQTEMSLAGGLSTNAPWRLRFVLKHTTFRSNELCTMTNLPIRAGNAEDAEETSLADVPINAGDEEEAILARVPINGTTLVIERTAGDGNLRAMIVPADDNYYLDFVDIPAADGRTFDRGKTYYVGQTDTNYSMGFPAGVTNVDLTFGVMRKVFIEVVAQPTPR